MELGTFFGEIKPFHAHILEDVYTILDRFILEKYPDDKVLKELVALDYYLFHKTIPKPLFVSEITREEKKQVLEQGGLDTQKYRYIVLPFGFDVQHFLENHLIVPEASYLIVGYQGITKTTITCIKQNIPVFL